MIDVDNQIAWIEAAGFSNKVCSFAFSARRRETISENVRLANDHQVFSFKPTFERQFANGNLCLARRFQ